MLPEAQGLTAVCGCLWYRHRILHLQHAVPAAALQDAKSCHPGSSTLKLPAAKSTPFRLTCTSPSHQLHHPAPALSVPLLVASDASKALAPCAQAALASGTILFSPK